MDKKPCLLIMISTFFPAKNGGGPVISLINLSKELKRTFKIYFISDHHDFGSSQPYTEVPNGWHKTNDYEIYYIPCGENTRKHIDRVINEVNPDVIYMNSVFDYHYCIPALLNIKVRKKEIPLIISTRGELCEGAFNLKKYKKSPYIFLLRNLGLFSGVLWHATSNDEVRGIVKYAHASLNRIFNLENIPSTFSVESSVKEKTPGKLKLVFVSRIQKKKNLYGAIRILNKIKDISIDYDIYGPMEDEIYWSQCQKLIEQSTANIKVKYCGMIEHSDIGNLFKSYHAYFMPTFSENYGHAIVEAMICGCPAIISDQTPWNGINTAKAGYALPLNTDEVFIDAIRQVAKMNQEEYSELVRNNFEYVKLNINNNEIVTKYKELFLSLIKI